MQELSIVGCLILLCILGFLAAPIIAYLSTSSKKTSTRGVKLSDETKSKFNTIFSEPTEKYISSLGNGFIINYLANGVVKSGFSIISTKRCYFRGRCYYKENGKLRVSFEERIIDLKDITGSGYQRINPTSILITSIISLATSLVGFVTGINSHGNISQMAGVIFLVTLPVFSVSLTTYLLKRRNLFEISFAGGRIAFNTNLYDKSEIDDFQKQLRRAKDNITDSLQAQQMKVHVDTNGKDSKIGTADELKKYAELLQQGLITLDEFNQVKKELISSSKV